MRRENGFHERGRSIDQKWWDLIQKNLDMGNFLLFFSFCLYFYVLFIFFTKYFFWYILFGLYFWVVWILFIYFGLGARIRVWITFTSQETRQGDSCPLKILNISTINEFSCFLFQIYSNVHSLILFVNLKKKFLKK